MTVKYSFVYSNGVTITKKQKDTDYLPSRLLLLPSPSPDLEEGGRGERASSARLTVYFLRQRQFVFPERGQIFRRWQERAINRRPEKLMNNARRRESGHSRDGDRWYPFISMPTTPNLLRPMPSRSRRQPGVGQATGRLCPLGRRGRIFLYPLALWTFVTFGGSYQSADVTPKRLPRRRPDCVIDFRCLLSSLPRALPLPPLAPSQPFCPLSRSFSPWLCTAATWWS